MDQTKGSLSRDSRAHSCSKAAQNWVGVYRCPGDGCEGGGDGCEGRGGGDGVDCISGTDGIVEAAGDCAPPKFNMASGKVEGSSGFCSTQIINTLHFGFANLSNSRKVGRSRAESVLGRSEDCSCTSLAVLLTTVWVAWVPSLVASQCRE